MKLIKTKLSLLALALACFFAGVMGLHPTATAKADIDTTGFTMTNGAYIRLVDDYSGISWTTTVSPEFYNRIEASVSSRFGVIVAPTNSFVGELTHETTLTSGSVKDIPVSSAVDASENAVTYRSVINYNDLFTNYSGPLSEEELLERAYAMELTARAYVTVDSGTTYIYASLDGINTSRSARQVAVAAELAGELDDYDPTLADNAKSYYGGSITVLAESNGAPGTPYIDKENPTATVNVSVAITGDFEEAVIGAESITATYSAGTLTITEANYIPTGEHYITIFTSTGVFATPVIGATKVLTTMSDFDMFRTIRNNKDNATNSKATVKATLGSAAPAGATLEDFNYDGYYVLGSNITGTNSQAAQGAQKVWDDVADFVGTELGLTGTFNGLGHHIEGYDSQDKYGGLFSLVNGGTIKNVALMINNTATQYGVSGFAYYAIDPKVENVYVTATGTGFDASQLRAGLFYTIYQSAKNKAKLTNVYVNATFTGLNGSRLQSGALFGKYSGYTAKFTVNGNEEMIGAITCKNLYVVSNYGICYNENAAFQMRWYGVADNNLTAYTGEGNEVVMPEGREAAAEAAGKTMVRHRSFIAIRCRDGYDYRSVEAMLAAQANLLAGQTAITAAFTPELTGGCWTTVSGVPTWVSTLS